MRAFQWNWFAPATPLRENDPFRPRWRVHFFLPRFFFVGLRHLPFTLRPAAERSTVNVTGAPTLRLKLTVVPFLARNFDGTSCREPRVATGPAVAVTATVFVAVTPAASVTVIGATWLPAPRNAYWTLAPAADPPSSKVHAYETGSASGSVAVAVNVNGVPTWAAPGVAVALVITGGWRWYSSAPISLRPLTTRGRPAKSVSGSPV